MARTYEHLAGRQRRPTDYEIASSDLLYYPRLGFEVRHPIGDWYERHQRRSRLRCDDWEQFADPRALTYADYTARRAEAETFLSGLRRAGEDLARLDPQWIETLDLVLAPMRFPVHGLQMLAAYVGQLAPSGRIVICAMFQAADELRRIHALAYRMRELQRVTPRFGEASRQTWQQHPLWQPLRAVVERMLVTWDFGEAFTALNLVLKPVLDALLTTELARLARCHGDDVLERTLQSVGEDCEWHREWAAALVRTAIEQRPQNAAPLREWIAAWTLPVDRALQAFEPILAPLRFDEVMIRAQAVRANLLSNSGLEAAGD